jgi:hypothetical protein
MSRIRLASLVVGGLMLAVPFTCRPFAATNPYTDFIAGVGNQAISEAVTTGFANTGNEALTNVLETPLTTLYQNLWTGWVNYTFPVDPTYNTLLVQ